MKHWYSSRGARRGLLLALLAVVLWGIWALVYTQGAKREARFQIQPSSSQVDTSCCLRQISV